MTYINSGLYVGMLKEFLEKNNSIDSLTILLFTTTTYINGPQQNLIVAAAFPSFARNKWLKPPRNLTGLVISYLGLVIGSFLLMVSFYIGHSSPSFSYQRLVGGFLLPFLGFALSFTHYFWCTGIVCCWLTEFTGDCEFRGCPVTNTEQLVGRYKQLERSLGPYFAFTFTTAQLNWISQLYMGVAGLNSPYSRLAIILFSGGSFLAAAAGTVIRSSFLFQGSNILPYLWFIQKEYYKKCL